MLFHPMDLEVVVVTRELHSPRKSNEVHSNIKYLFCHLREKNISVYIRICRWWNSALESNAKVIIPLSTGWNPTPRYNSTYFLQPTAKELQTFIRAAIELTCTYKNVTEAQTVIIYAWNECDENGAAIIPSLGNGTYFVRALNEILPMTC